MSFDNRTVLQYLSARGSVDGVTRNNTLTEDGLPAGAGSEMIRQLRQLTGFAPAPAISPTAESSEKPVHYQPSTERESS